MRALALGGVAGPVLFSLVVMRAGALRPGYSHVTQFISELGATATPDAWLMNYAGFLPAGVLLAGFGVSLSRLLPRSRSTTAASILIAMFGAGVTASGFISCDAGCPQTGGSVENFVHDKIAPVSFLSLIVAVGLLGLHFRRLEAWRALSLYSLATGAAALCFLIALVSSLESRELTGLWQRLMLGVLFLWCIVVGTRAYRAGAA